MPLKTPFTQTAITITTFAIATAAPPTTTHAAAPYTFDDLTLFQSQTAATATTALPNNGLAAQPFAVGDLSFSTPGQNLFVGTGDGTQWTTLNTGHDIAISGLEELNIDLAAPVTAFGFEFIEPQTGVAGFVDSTFTVELFDGPASVGTFTFERPNDQLTHVAAASPAPFDRVEIRETTGAGENEFFGQFYTANTNNKFWDNLTSGHWGTTTNWDPTGTPAPTDNVFITPNTTNDTFVFGPTTPTTIATLTIANTNPAKNTTFILETTGPLTLTGDLLVDQNGHLDIPTGATLSASGTNGTPPTNANNFTINQGQLTLDGTANFNGGTGADSTSSFFLGEDGADAPQINFTNTTANLDDGTLNANGGTGGGGFFHVDEDEHTGGGQGGNGGQLTIDDNATVNLTNTAAINLRGGVGGDAGALFGDPYSGQGAGLGGNGGSLTLDTNANLTLNNATIDIRGGSGGGASSLDGHAGPGGTVTLDNNASLTLTTATIDLSGGNGGRNGDGGNAGSLTATQGDLSLTNATLNLNGGIGGAHSPPIESYGGHGGQVTITNGNHTIDNSTLNLNGGSGNFIITFDSFGGGGNGGLINITGGTTTLQNAPTINLKPGTGGSPSPGAVNITAGTLNINSALITANNTTPSADPINIIAAPLTLSGTGTLNLNANTTLNNTTNINSATTYNQTGDLTILGTLNINNTATLNAPSSNDAHNLTVDGGTFSLNGTANFNGNNGSDGISFDPNGNPGGDAPTITLTDATTTFHPGSTLNARGGHGGDAFDPFFDIAGNGGHGATLNATNGTLNINDATLNLQGGDPGTTFAFVTPPGNPATVNLNNTNTTISGNSLINISPGNGGSSLAQLTITDGTLTLNAAQITADTSFTPTTPIAIVSTTTTITGAPTININDDLTLHDATFDLPPAATFNLDTNATINAQDASSLTLHGPRTIEPTQAYNILTNSDFYQHGDLTVQGTLNIDNTSTLNATPPKAPLNTPGTPAYPFNADTATISVQGTINLNGGHGGTSFDNFDGELGGAGPTITLNNATTTLHPASTFNANGGAGGAGKGEFTVTNGGDGGDGAHATITGGSLNINATTFNLNGGNGGDSDFYAGGTGGNGGQLTLPSGNLTIDAGTLNLKGANGGESRSSHQSTGGNGGTLNLQGGTTTLSNAATVNLSPGIGDSEGPINPGLPGNLTLAGTATLNINSATVTADTTFIPATPIAIVNTQNTITGSPTLNLNDDTTLEDTNLDLPPTATFNLDPAAALTAQNNASLTLHGDRTIPSTQAIHITSGSTFRNYGGFNVQGQLNIAGGTLNASTTDNDLLPPAGQNAHHLTIDGGTFSTTTLTRFNPGEGAEGPDGQTGGNGATIHLISGLLNIDGGTLLAPGGNGGISNDEPGTGGTGGNGGNTTISDGLLLSFNGTLNLAGGAGGNGETQAGSGGNAGNLNIDGGEATFNGGTIFMQGGVPETIIHGGDGGNGGNINVTGGTFFAGTTTINLKGRNGGNGDLSTGAPGNGGSLNISGGTTTFNFATHVDMTPGNGGTRGQLNLTGGTLNLHEATLTGNNSIAAADPINLVGTTFNVTNTGQLNLTDTTRIADATLNHSDGTTIQSISMNVVTGGTYNLNAGVLTGSPTPTVSPDPITLFNTSVALTGGDLNLNDNTTMNGGSLTQGPASDFNLAPGKRFTATNNAQVDLFDDILQIHENRTFEITNGSTLTVEIFLGVGLESSGTLLVDNATVQTGSAGPFNAPWGIGVGHADVTIRNNATANFGNNIDFVGTGAPGHSGTFRLQSGADMTVHNFDIASNSSGNANVLVDGPGTTLTQIGPATLELGASSFNTATLDVTNNAVFTTGTGPIAIKPTGNLTIDTNATFNANATTTVDGTINLAGGTMNATDINLNPSGTFNFTGGTLHVDNFTGTLTNNGGTLAPGHSPGITNITNDYTQLPAATLQIEVLNPATPTPGAGTDNDQLNITANVTLAGTLEIAPLPDNGPITDTPLGTTYDILSYNTRTPDSYFDTITGTILPGVTDFALAPLHNEFFKGILLRASIPGDLNLDNTVSVADLAEFALNFDTTPGLYNEASNTNSWELGDFNTDGAITVADLSLLALNFGFGTTSSLTFQDAATLAGIDLSGITTLPAIPEPTTAYILIALALPFTKRPTKQIPNT